MSIKVGNQNVTGAFLGTQEISKMYLGSSLVWESASNPPAIRYFFMNGFESGTPEDQILNTHAGDPDQFAVATENTLTGGVLRYDNIRAHSGSQSARVATGTTAVGAFVGANIVTGTPKAGVWIYLTSYPPSRLDLIQFVTTTGGTSNRARCSISTTGQGQVLNGSSIRVTTTGTVPLNAWTLVSADLDLAGGSASGVGTVRLYTDSGLITGGEASATDQTFTTATIEQVRFGSTTNIANLGPFWMDDIAVDDTNIVEPQ